MEITVPRSGWCAKKEKEKKSSSKEVNTKCPQTSSLDNNPPIWHKHSRDKRCELLPNEQRRWRERRGGSLRGEHSTEKGGTQTKGRKGEDNATFPSSLHYLLSPIPLSPLTRDSFLLVSHLSLPLQFLTVSGDQTHPWQVAMETPHTRSFSLSILQR